MWADNYNKVQVQKIKGNMDEDNPMDMWPYKIQYSKDWANWLIWGKAGVVYIEDEMQIAKADGWELGLVKVWPSDSVRVNIVANYVTLCMQVAEIALKHRYNTGLSN